MASEFVVQSAHRSNRNGPGRFIFSNIIRHPITAIMLMIGAFSNAALAAAVPVFTGIAFDALLNRDVEPNAMETTALMVLAIIGSSALRAVLQFMRNFAAESYSQRIERDVRDELYASLLGKSMTFHDMQPVGEIMARVTNDVRELNFFMNPGINLLIGSAMFLVVPVLAAPLIYPELILTPLLFVIAHLFIQIQFVRELHPIAEQARASFGRMNARLAEALDGLQIVKGTAQEEAEIARVAQLTDVVRDYSIRQGEVEGRYLSYLALGLAFPIGLLHAASLYEAGRIQLGDIIGFMGLIFQFGFPVFTSVFSLSRIASGYASAERILNIINAQTGLDRNPNGYDQEIRGAIRFESVHFRYQKGDKEVLRDISFSIQPGQTVAIVGQTGAGKTTIIKLINRIYDADGGRVLVDDVDVRDWSLEALRSQISIIEQDIFLFSRSIADNIAFGKPEATREAIIEAAQKAQADEFIRSFPQGYDTIVGQRGVTLSGGQRQRIALARAFLTNPPILILDDSTSAIDSATEDRIQRAIWAAAEGRTTIIITHRLSQIRWADHIIVLRNGAIAAQGTHQDLLRDSEAYRRIFARYETAEAHTPSLATAEGND